MYEHTLQMFLMSVIFVKNIISYNCVTIKWKFFHTKTVSYQSKLVN